MRHVIYLLLIFVFMKAALAEDYSVNGSSIQFFETAGIESVEIWCYCSENIVIERQESGSIELEVSATKSSVGYHGEQTEKNKVSEQLLNFHSEKLDSKLVLISKEYTFIHHAFIINKIKLILPNNIKYTLMPISYSMLEGRNP